MQVCDLVRYRINLFLFLHLNFATCPTVTKEVSKFRKAFFLGIYHIIPIIII